MSVRIVLPDGKGPKAAMGTKVYTDSGMEIERVSRIQIDILPDSILEATITVPISEIENLEGLEGVIVSERSTEDDD